MQFDSQTAAFELVYVSGEKGGTTEIFASAKWYYGTGMVVEVEGGGEYTVSESLVEVTTTVEEGTEIRVRITAKV